MARFRTIAGSAQLARGSPQIASDAEDAYALYMPSRGEHEITQFGRSVRCTPGSVIMVSMAEPLVHTKLGDNDTNYLFLPRDFVDQRLVGPEDSCARAVSTAQGLQRLMRESFAVLQQTASQMNDEQFRCANRVVCDLALMAVSGSESINSDARSVRAANLARVKRAIRSRLAELDLTLTAVAGQCGLSLRYLHTLFRDEACSAAEYLKQQRLQRAQRMLQEASPASTTVTEVALACGFSNPSQFSTAFRREFSISPKDILRRR